MNVKIDVPPGLSVVWVNLPTFLESFSSGREHSGGGLVRMLPPIRSGGTL